MQDLTRSWQDLQPGSRLENLQILQYREKAVKQNKVPSKSATLCAAHYSKQHLEGILTRRCDSVDKSPWILARLLFFNDKCSCKVD